MKTGKKLAIYLVLAVALISAGCSSSSPNTRIAAPLAEELGPQLGDHWHSSYALFICGQFLPPLLSDNDPYGIHSHADGLIHIHPRSEDATRENATLNRFTEVMNLELTESSITLKDSGITYSEEEGCNGQPATVSVARWNLASGSPELDPPQIFTTGLENIRFLNNAEAYTISLLPEGSSTPPLPISTAELIKREDILALGNILTARELGLAPAKVAASLQGETLTGATPCPNEPELSIKVIKFSEPPPLCIDPQKRYTAVFDTSQGEIRVNLNTRTISTTNIFVVLARYRYYDNSALFRTDPLQGIVQGGAVHTNSATDEGPGFTIPDENLSFTYMPGQIIMARSPERNSANGQFFFTVTEESRRLNRLSNLTVFGEIVEGLDVLQKILSLNIMDPDAQTEEEKRFSQGPVLPVIVNTLRIQES